MNGTGNLVLNCVNVSERRSTTSVRRSPVSTIWSSRHIVSDVSMKASMLTSLNMKSSKSFKRQTSSGLKFWKDMQLLSRMPKLLMRKRKCWFATSRQRQSESQLLKQTYSSPLSNASLPTSKLLSTPIKSWKVTCRRWKISNWTASSTIWMTQTPTMIDLNRCYLTQLT